MTESAADAVAREYARKQHDLVLGRLLCGKLVRVNDGLALSYQTHDTWILNCELLGGSVRELENNTLYLCVDDVTGTVIG